MALDIPLPEPAKPDIYSYGFNKLLHRDIIQEKSPLVYNSIGDALNPALLSAGTILSPITIESLKVNNLTGGSLITIQGWQFDNTFSATDVNTVEWTSGTITLADGTTFSIDAGNTGNMAALTYIYFSKADSETVLQTSSTASDAVGANKILIAVAENNGDAGATEATFQVFGGSGGTLLMSDNIAANSITANEIAANTITASEIFTGTITTTQLSATAIDGMTITGSTIRTAASGARVVLDSSNYIQGFDASKLRMQLVTDQLRFYNAEGGDTDYVYLQAIDETILGTSFHSLKFSETWGAGNRDIMFGFHLFPATDSTWDLGMQSGGDLAWRSVYTDEVVTDKIDLLNASRLDLPAKIASSFGVYATDTTKYLKVDTNQGTPGSGNPEMYNSPYVSTDYHSIRFEVSVGGDQTGHVIATKGASLGSEIGVLKTAAHKWIVMVHDGDNGRIGSAGWSGNSHGGAIVLDPGNGLVVIENGDSLHMYQEANKYWNIDPTGGYLVFTPNGLTGSHGIKFASYILPSSDGNLNFGGESNNWAQVYTKKISYSTGEIFDFIANSANVEINRHLVPDQDNHLTCGAAAARWSDTRTVLFNGADVGFENDWYLTEAEKLGIDQEGVVMVDQNNELKIFIGKNGIYVPGGNIKNLDKLKWVKTTLDERSKMDKEWKSRERGKESKSVYTYPDPKDAQVGGGIYKKKILWKPNNK